MKYITLEQIKRHHPCASEFRRVKRFFGKRKRIVVTVRRAVAVADQFNFDWLAEHLLTTVPARQAYADATAPARQAYNDASATADKAYADAKAAAFARAYLNQ